MNELVALVGVLLVVACAYSIIIKGDALGPIEGLIRFIVKTIFRIIHGVHKLSWKWQKGAWNFSWNARNEAWKRVVSGITCISLTAITAPSWILIEIFSIWKK